MEEGDDVLPTRPVRYVDLGAMPRKDAEHYLNQVRKEMGLPPIRMLPDWLFWLIAAAWLSNFVALIFANI